MTFEQRFVNADEFLNHTDAMMQKISDQIIQQRYLGFITVNAVTVYELAIKDIIYRFSDQKHSILGKVSRSVFERMNGRIKLRDLKENHISRFGDRYVDRFNKILEEKETESLQESGSSIKASYGNVITWRNNFTHGTSESPITTNYLEVKRSYMLGKKVIYCLDMALVR